MGSTQWFSGSSAGTLKSIKTRRRQIYFSHRIRPPESLLTINGQNIHFVNIVNYLGIIFDRKITWKLHIKMIETKAFRAFIKMYSLFKSEHLNANIKLTLYKALIRSIMTYASPPGNLLQIPIC
jgi:hypothetical protein